jgi:hypothetical protein
MANAIETKAQDVTKKVTKKANETKKVEPKAKKANTKLDALAAKFPSLAKAKATSSIYKAELFEGLDDKAKKATRRKARRLRDNFIGRYLQANGNKEELKGLQKEWKEFAAEVYNNSSFIFEKNTSAEDQKIMTQFIKAMAADYTK